MNEFENQEVVNPAENDNQVENPQMTEETPATFEEAETEEVVEEVVEQAETEVEAEENAQEEEVVEEPSEFDLLQQQFNDLQNSYNELQSNYEVAQTRIAELEEFQTNANTEIETLKTQNQNLQSSLQSYEDLAVKAENDRKEQLVEKYEKVLKEEEIKPIKDTINDFSYDELESKLAIIFANKQMAGGDKKVPLPEPQESQFALFMKKYRKN